MLNSHDSDLSANTFSRRDLLKVLGAAAIAFNLPVNTLFAASKGTIVRKIPATGEKLAIMGLGTSRTFDIDIGRIDQTSFVELLQSFFDRGGQLIDSSPMYGNSESVVGELIKRVSNKDGYFAATKVWTDGKKRGIDQMNSSLEKMGVDVMDLMQIHNLRDWKTHLQTLREWKEQGKIRYIGITTSHGRDHGELAKILKTETFDFVQFTYNILDREAEKTLFPIVRDKGIATVINRAYRRGDLFRMVKGKALPDWANEFDCASWGQFFLKFVGGHPGVTNIIPATTKLRHMADNMAAGCGRLPDSQMRQRMIHYIESI